jgi:hypothetical protein
MLVRRNALKQIIALAVAPAIIRVASIMPINSSLSLTAEDYSIDMGDFDAALRGIVVSPSQYGGDIFGSGLVVRNTTAKPIKLGGLIVPSGAAKLASKFLTPIFVDHR